MTSPRGSNARVLSGLLLLAGGGALGWFGHAALQPAAESADEAEEEGALPDPAEMSVAVVTRLARRGRLPLVLDAVGTTRAEARAILSLGSRAGGRVSEVLVAPGATVERGALLMRFDPLPLQAQLARAHSEAARASSELADFEGSGRARELAELQTALSTADSERELASTRLAALAPLQADGLVSERELAEARSLAVRSEQAQVLARSALAAWTDSRAELRRATLLADEQAAQRAVQEVEARLAEVELHAPLAGILLELSVRAGQQVEAGAELGSLLASDARLLRFGVSAARVRELRLGARARWRDSSGTARTGVIASLPAGVSPESGLAEVLVAPDADQVAGLLGEVVKGELELSALEDVLLVPEAAVVRAEDRTTVVVAGADERAHVIEVQVLGRHDGLAAVAGELQAGERVLIEGGYNLPDGAQLSARADDASEAPEAHGAHGAHGAQR